MKERKPPKDIADEQMNIFIKKIRRSWWRWGFLIDYCIVAMMLIGLWQILEFKDACVKCTDIQLVKCPYTNQNLTIPNTTILPSQKLENSSPLISDLISDFKLISSFFWSVSP